MTYVKKYKINVTVGNDHDMKCDLKGSVKMKMQGRETTNLIEVLYVAQSFE